LTFGATEDGIADGVSVIVASAVKLSEGAPTSMVGWARVAAPNATNTPTPSAADSAVQLPRKRWKFMGFINSFLHRVFAVWLGKATCVSFSRRHRNAVIGDDIGTVTLSEADTATNHISHVRHT
jgi:hypothetical protein